MTVPGVDVSRWQGAMDWQVCAGAGAKFAFVRAGSCSNQTGAVYTDDQYLRNAELAPDHLITGAYWYFRPNWSPQSQADYFVSLGVGDLPLPPVCDVENNGWLGQTAVANAVRNFVDAVEANTGRKCLIYTRATFWNPGVGNPAWAGGHHLWVARYNEFVAHPWADDPDTLRPEPWTDWTFWQWSADGNGQGPTYGAESSAIDLNRWNGTYDDLLAYVGLEPEPDLEQRVADLEAAQVEDRADIERLIDWARSFPDG